MTILKKKKSKAYLPTLFFSGKEPETQLFFFGLKSTNVEQIEIQAM